MVQTWNKPPSQTTPSPLTEILRKNKVIRWSLEVFYREIHKSDVVSFNSNVRYGRYRGHSIKLASLKGWLRMLICQTDLEEVKATFPRFRSHKKEANVGRRPRWKQ